MWAVLFGMLAQPPEPASIEPTARTNPKQVNQPELQAQAAQSTEPNMALLLFLAEWDEAGHEQGIDPATFTADDALNLQLDNEQSNHHENNHPDHH